MGRKKNSIGQQLKSYCYMLNVAEEATIEPRGYSLQKKLNLLPNQLKQKEGNRNNKWDRYFIFKDKIPSKDTLKQIQKKYKKSSYILSLLLWEILDIPMASNQLIYDILLKMPANIKKHLFSPNYPYGLKAKISSRAVEAIERLGTEHALTCFLGLSRLEFEKKIVIERYEPLKHVIERLIKRCALMPPLNKVKGELFEAVVIYVNTPYTIPDNNIIVASRVRFLEQVNSLNFAFDAFDSMHITEKTKNQNELTYWLMKSNDEELIDDLKSALNKLPLKDNQNGLLTLLQQMMCQSRGLMKDRLNFLYHHYKDNKHITNTYRR